MISRLLFALFWAVTSITPLVANADSFLPLSCDSVIPFTKEELLGRINPSNHPSFEAIALSFATKESMYMRKEAYEAFKKMHAAAKKDGITLMIVSATRNFDAQKGIWERKWKRPQYEGKPDLDRIQDIMKFSSMPGTSRHHWGTDIDLNSVEPSYFLSGKGLLIYQWLSAHAPEYGYRQTYTSKINGRTGYEEEAWHWSYMPLAGPMLKAYNATIAYSDIAGFSGSASASQARVFEEFVNGIDPELLK
ncbi:MAG: M15 family metallopeptidase [Flavobacteriales bacterium]